MLNKFFGFLMVFLLIIISPATLAENAVFALLTSSADQLVSPDTVNLPIPVKLQNIDKIQGLQWDPQQNRMLIQQTGTYLIMSGIQVGARQSASNIVKGGDIFYWIALNGTMIQNTGSWIFASPQSRSKTIANLWVTDLKQGDYLQFMFSSSAPSMGLISISGSAKIPNSPGVTLTMIKLPPSTPFKQLISSNSQTVSAADINKAFPIAIGTSKDNAVTIPDAGMYVIMTKAKVGARQVVSIPKQGGNIYYWFELNGKVVPNSTSYTHISANSKVDTLLENLALSLNKGDILRFMFSSSISGVGMLTFRGTEFRPDSPSFKASLFKLE